MPSTSKKQHNLMAAVANNPAFAKKAGIPQSVGSDFIKADKGRTFAKGGDTMASKMNAGFAAMIAKKKGMKEGSKSEMAIDKKMGMTKMAKGGCAMAKGGGIETKGKTKGKMVKMAGGGCK